MDNAQKAIMIGVGLFITIIIIAAVMLLLGVGQDLIGGGTVQLSGVSGSFRTQTLNQYEGKILNGSQVLNAVRTYYDSDSICIAVKNYFNDQEMQKYGLAYCGAGGIGFSYRFPNGRNDKYKLTTKINVIKFKTSKMFSADDTNRSSQFNSCYNNKTPIELFTDSSNKITYIDKSATYQSLLVVYDPNEDHTGNIIFGILFNRIK